jgi:glycosyltransferase involved in cell wall biosynthesis
MEAVLEQKDMSSFPARPTVEIAVPVLNEAVEIERQLRRLRAELDSVEDAPWSGRVAICVADNGSADTTVEIARSLASELAPLRVLSVPRRGKGFGVIAAWESSRADVVAYTDLDLSASPDQLAGLVSKLGHADVAVGSRYANGASRSRSLPRILARSLPSRVYRVVMRHAVPVPVRDVHCGLKAARRSSITPVLGELRHGGWFFDTEMLVLSAVLGGIVAEVPVRWIDDPESRVRVVSVAKELLGGLIELRSRLRKR